MVVRSITGPVPVEGILSLFCDCAIVVGVRSCAVRLSRVEGAYIISPSLMRCCFSSAHPRASRSTSFIGWTNFR